jgi:hypothetical protein
VPCVAWGRNPRLGHVQECGQERLAALRGSEADHVDLVGAPAEPGDPSDG